MTQEKKSPPQGAEGLSAIRRADPFFEREREQYDHPLPSREYVEQILADRGVPMRFEELCEALDVSEAECGLFERRLRAMERDGQVMRNRRDTFILPDKAALVKGRVQGHPDGFGFVVRDDGEQDLFLGPKEMRSVLHGDRILTRVAGTDRRGRPEGKVVKILERANTRIVGRVLDEHGVLMIVPEDRRIAQDILIAQGGRKGAKAGQVVTVEVIEQPTKVAQPIGRVVEVIGNYADPGMEIEIALRKHALPFEFSSDAKAQTRRLPAVVRRKDWKGRVDLTELPFVTIDGETAKDFDDAVYCERAGDGYRLIVAIADVSHYVEAGSALDRDALERGNSVYFPRRVIPMLPEKLSNGLCSLVPREERLCMACDMIVTSSGQISEYRFYQAVIYSHERLTYDQVAAALYDKDPDTLTTLRPVLPYLENLDQLFRSLLKARAERGAIEFESTETRMIFDDEGKIERIVPEVRNDAHRIIEECMLAANVCASDFLQKRKQPVLYRVHEGPSVERLEKLRSFLGGFGLSLDGGDEPSAKDYGKVLEAAKLRPDAALLQTMMLRSLRQAVYSPDNAGHFGLAYESYTHFTSPIRRYPDLLVHRAIKAVLADSQYDPGDWEQIGLQCSATERRADEATRDVVAWLKCWFMRDRVGEVFEGSVSSVVPFGLFVALDDIFIEGLVHISDLGSDYFHYDETRHELAGERTSTRYRLADRLKVQVVRVDLETSKIDFRLVEGETGPTVRTGKTERERSASQPRGNVSRKHSRDTAPAEQAGSQDARSSRAGKPAGSAQPKKTKKTAAAKKPGTVKKEDAGKQSSATKKKKGGSRG